MKKNHLLLLFIPLLALSCSKNEITEEDWKTIPEEAYLDITEMKKLTVYDLPSSSYGQRAVIELNSSIRERVMSYSNIDGKAPTLTITYLGEPVMELTMRHPLADSFPSRMCASFYDPGFLEDPLKCWIWTWGDDSDFDLFIKELKSRKVPVKQNKERIAVADPHLILGTWLASHRSKNPKHADTCDMWPFTFNADGTGRGPWGSRAPFTYEIGGNQITLHLQTGEDYTGKTLFQYNILSISDDGMEWDEICTEDDGGSYLNFYRHESDEVEIP